MSELATHRFELVNDDFRVTVDATCSETTWNNLIRAVTDQLAKPIAILTFPEKVTPETARSIREAFRDHHRRNG